MKFKDHQRNTILAFCLAVSMRAHVKWARACLGMRRITFAHPRLSATIISASMTYVIP